MSHMDIHDHKIKLIETPHEKRKIKIKDHSKLGFGQHFSDHMFLMEYFDNTWHNPRIEPYQPFVFDPATICLHYGQGIFEGLKAYRNEHNIYLFRPELNLKRMNESAKRMMMPTFDEQLALNALKQLCQLEEEWIPDSQGTALYLRPTMIATEACLGIRPASQYLFYVIASPVGAYFEHGYQPTKLMVSDKYVRAAPGGAGAAKTMGNYATSMLATHEAHQAGFNQVLWLDAIHKKYIEEVGVMNFFALINDELVTPHLSGTILPGVTRDSVITLTKSWGLNVSERQLSIDELTQGIESGAVKEIFGTGTAAVISPVSHIHYKEKTYQVQNADIGQMTTRIFNELTAIQLGKQADPFGWVMKI